MSIDREAQQACAVGAQLGEGPLWIERDRTLRFVDIKGKRVYRYDPATADLKHATAPEQPGFVVPVRGGGFLAGLKNGLHRFDDHRGTFTKLKEVEPQLPGNRLNDGAVGPDGALWFGSMDDGEEALSGALYRMAPGAAPVSLDKGYCITNGPAFSPDGRTFYHTDTLKRVVYAFDVSPQHTLSNKRPFVTIKDGEGHPDGSVVDSEGCLWVALFGGWGVRRYSPKGELLNVVRFPCANVTKIAFGGADLRTAYATTAWKGLSADERNQQPHAGDLFAFRTDIPGLPAKELVLDA
jgi:xylono-1,5-lactonase